VFVGQPAEDDLAADRGKPNVSAQEALELGASVEVCKFRIEVGNGYTTG
jgi:hypothetical protein